MINRTERRRIEAIRRRVEYLTGQVAAGSVNSRVRQELAAMTWAADTLEALLQDRPYIAPGTLHRKMEPDPMSILADIDKAYREATFGKDGTDISWLVGLEKDEKDGR